MHSIRLCARFASLTSGFRVLPAHCPPHCTCCRPLCSSSNCAVVVSGAVLVRALAWVRSALVATLSSGHPGGAGQCRSPLALCSFARPSSPLCSALRRATIRPGPHRRTGADDATRARGHTVGCEDERSKHSTARPTASHSTLSDPPPPSRLHARKGTVAGCRQGRAESEGRADGSTPLVRCLSSSDPHSILDEQRDASLLSRSTAVAFPPSLMRPAVRASPDSAHSIC